ncbi:nitric oxide synthase [Rhodococcus sp. D2-41]|uniref:Flavodoxin domain-containing protein n=1 Tax=Speluncibacter jeojiensis TaxID=2710754 RepID=A0A9X4RGF7_9ACTN|nr:flavodoxin domain-containing protein [Rhodococcus sp. D2-41]MDG3010996.1 nitric oxide synthase [Rhodococcus sp. D2-41]MDG3013971.1 flavodoxin domain-containing protein [Corynebacteriales bacterium D3-21]
MRVVILYGTESGTSEAVAYDLADALGGHCQPSVFDMGDYDVTDLDRSTFHVLVCSTYGDGELPASAEPFFDALGEQRPDLSGLRFTVLGLGDSIYDTTFNQAAELVAGRFVELGAERVGSFGPHDANSTVAPGDKVTEWADALLSGGLVA